MSALVPARAGQVLEGRRHHPAEAGVEQRLDYLLGLWERMRTRTLRVMLGAQRARAQPAS